MLNESDYQLLTLAAMAECLARVDATANGRGDHSEQALAPLTAALFNRDAANLEALFPDPRQFNEGLTIIMDTLRGSSKRSAVVRYLISVLDLTKRLKRNDSVQQRIATRIDEISQLSFERRIEVVGELYEATIATLGRRVQVVGNPSALQREGSAATIRTLLLCAIRFAWLWDQLGGRRWRLVVRSKALLSSLQDLQARI